MARTELEVKTTKRTNNGLNSTYLTSYDTVNGMYFNNISEGVMVIMFNNSADTRTVEFILNEPFDGIDYGNLTVTLEGYDRYLIGPFPNRQYGSGNNSKRVHIDIDNGEYIELFAFKSGSIKSE